MKTLYLFLTTITASTFMCKFSYAESYTAPGMQFNEQSKLQKMIQEDIQEKAKKQSITAEEEYLSSIFAIKFAPTGIVIRHALEINPDIIIEHNLEKYPLDNDIDVNILEEGPFETEEIKQIRTLFYTSCETKFDSSEGGTLVEDILINMGKELRKNINSKHPKLSITRIPLEDLYAILKASDLNSKKQTIECFLLGKSILDAIELTLVERFTQLFPANKYPFIQTRLESMKIRTNTKILVDAFFYPIFYRIKSALFNLNERGLNEGSDYDSKILLHEIYN